METTLALEEARELVRTGWCQMHAAKTARGGACFAFSKAAVQFCVSGAVARVTWPWDDKDDQALWETTQECYELLARAIRENGWDMSEHTPWHVINEWNDEPTRTKDEVLALFDRAIEKAREGEVA